MPDPLLDALAGRRAAACALLLLAGTAAARDLDGRYADHPLRQWFQGLKNEAGVFCCAEADGMDADYQMVDGTYWVSVGGDWRRVPSWALIAGPNYHGRAMVWLNADGTVRCFMPADGT